LKKSSKSNGVRRTIMGYATIRHKMGHIVIKPVL
jgi:hypothetical protein